MEKNPSNQSIDRMFQIIEAMAFTGKPMRLNDIAEKSRIPARTAASAMASFPFINCLMPLTPPP